MVSRATPLLTADVWKYIFHYLDFHGQQCCARVCRQWNLFLHELQYEYGRCQALEFGWMGPLRISLATAGQFSVQGWRDHYILLSPRVPRQAGLWFRDLRGQESQEVRQDPKSSLANLIAARWISQDKFATVLDVPSDKFFQVIVWKVSKEKELYQITQIAQQMFKNTGTIAYVLPLENRIFINIEEDVTRFHPPQPSRQRSQWIISVEGSGIIEKREIDPLLRTQTMFFSDQRQRIFALNGVQNIKAYDLADEKTAKLAWEVEHVYSHIYPMEIEANDRWFIKRNIQPLSNDAFREESSLRIVDVSTGKYSDITGIKRHSSLRQPFWVDGDCLHMLHDADLRIIHIPTKKYLTAMHVSDWRKLVMNNSSSLHRIYMDQDTLRVVYEDDQGLQVHAVKLEKHQPLWAQSNKWKAVKNFLGFLIAFPRLFWQWIRTLL